MKIALCFIISYKHILNKEQIWIDWIKPNKDIINIYFHYKDYKLISSNWIKKHAIPDKYICPTNYLHIVSAYMTLMKYAITHDTDNNWFCFLTESCVPIISPLKFRKLFLENYNNTIMSWKPAYWNPSFSKRANLKYFKPEFHLANTPWFILNKEDTLYIINYSIINKKIYNIICNGEVANESIFAIILYCKNNLKDVINAETNATDWSRMMSSTSPYLFKNGDYKDKHFIEDFLTKNKYCIFLRKVDCEFPDEIIMNYIKKDDNIVEPFKNKKINYYFISLFVMFLHLLTFPSISTFNTCNKCSHRFIS